MTPRILPVLVTALWMGCTAATDDDDDSAGPVQVEPPTTIEGQVVSYPEGDPIEGIPVVVFDERALYEIFYTDEDGYYSAPDLPEDFYRVKAWPLDGQLYIGAYYNDTYFYCLGQYVDMRWDAQVSGIDFRLPHGGAIEGTITDADSGDPIADARIDVSGQDYYNTNIDPTTYTDAEGYFQVVGLDSAIENAETMTPVPGNYELKVSVGGRPVMYYPGVYFGADQEFVEALRDEVTSGVDLAIPSGGQISGTVYDSQGTAVTGGTVYVRHATETWIQANTTVDADGTYLATGLAPGDYTVQTTSSGWASQVLADTVVVLEGTLTAGVDVALAEEAILSGIVTAGGVPLESVSIRAMAVLGGLSTSTTTDENGEFQAEALGEGEHRLYLQPPDDRYITGYLCGDDLCASPMDGDVFALAHGVQTAVGTIALPEAAVLTGRITEANTGRPLGRIYVTAMAVEDGSTKLKTTDEEGVYRFGGMAAGAFQLMAEPYRYCLGDPGWVTTYSGDARRIDDAAIIDIAVGEETAADLQLPRDEDGDGMDDLWERFHFLDPYLDDSLDDHDGDGVVNLDEYLEGTDPADPATDSGGCQTAPGGPWPRCTMVLALGLLYWFTARRRRTKSFKHSRLSAEVSFFDG